MGPTKEYNAPRRMRKSTRQNIEAKRMKKWMHNLLGESKLRRRTRRTDALHQTPTQQPKKNEADMEMYPEDTTPQPEGPGNDKTREQEEIT